MINNKIYPDYTINKIENIMSLRIPQKQSVKILDYILDDIKLSKNVDLKKAYEIIHGTYSIFKSFEHEFLSLAFALATGVGKTKLMGSFITYLYTNKSIKNFFVVAPNLTIYEKLKNDLGNPAQDNEKYVFKGVGCFSVKQPNIWVDDDYRNRPAQSLVDNDSVNIYIFNISKFNSEERKIMGINEYLGQSFFDYLRSMEDLVIIMDESHHYRAKASYEAINSLDPVLGLELTATPQIQQGSKTILFQNVVYEYPLSRAIKDGYTRTPFALTRRDVKSFNFDDEELDKMMINDGIKHHENMKAELKGYSINNQTKYVKPFMLIVCKNTKHAEEVLKYVQSDSFRYGEYKGKVIMIHSNQRGEEKDENIRLLLDVEKTDSPVEIVIHVNILKEGWDVNNLYTIVPLRTATSKTLREQTVGRGLRLPFGKRTGEKMIDSVTITAHDKFDEIIAEAQSPDSIFNKEGVIYAENEKEKEIVQTQLNLIDLDEKRGEILEKAGLDHNDKESKDTYRQVISSSTEYIMKVKEEQSKTGYQINDKTKEQFKKDIGERFRDNSDAQKLIDTIADYYMGEISKEIDEKVMYIPKIKTEDFGDEEYIIQDFDLDLSEMKYVPIQNDILIQNLLDSHDESIIIKGETINFESFIPEVRLVNDIRDIPEINYEKCSKLVQKLVMQFLNHYRSLYSEKEIRSICFVERKDITNQFKKQLIQNFAVKYTGIVEVVSGIETIVHRDTLDTTKGSEIKNILEPPGEINIKSIIYEGSRKAVKTPFKFDSDPERIFAIVCDNSSEVIQWLRPAASQFNITYNRGKRYQPDFVVETNERYYLVEVKRRDQMKDPNVLAKKDRAIAYCKVASQYNKANGHKEFKYLFIPHDEISASSSFNNLKDRYNEE